MWRPSHGMQFFIKSSIMAFNNWPSRDHSTGCSLSGTDCSIMGPPHTTATAPSWAPLHRLEFWPGACSSMSSQRTTSSFRAYPLSPAGLRQASVWCSSMVPPEPQGGQPTIVFYMDCTAMIALVLGARLLTPLTAYWFLSQFFPLLS